MLQRICIQIIDNPMKEIILDAEEFEELIRNKSLADELKKEMTYNYPTVVAVEYIDLFMDDSARFPEIKELLTQGRLQTPVILINGIPKIHGGIPKVAIRNEVEKILSSGPVH